MEPPIRQHLRATYFPEYQGLRIQLTELLTDPDLEFRPGGATASLGELCREIGEIEYAYIESFRTFRLDFGYHQPDSRVEHSMDALSSWYARLDGELMEVLESLSEDEIANRRIVRTDFDVDDFSPLPPVQLDIYREALLIFYGKVSVYLKVMGKPLPEQWQAWIG